MPVKVSGSGSEGRGDVSRLGFDAGGKMKSYSSSLCLESLEDIVSHNVNVKNGWAALELESAVTETTAGALSLSSISVRRNVVADVNDEIERMYLSFGIKWFEYDNVKGVLKLDLCLLQMEEDELHEDGGYFPLVLDSDKDEALIRRNHMNDMIAGKAVIVHFQMKENESEGLGLGHVQTFDMRESSSFLSHGSTQFSINEKQLLLTAAKAEAKNRNNSNEARFSKSAKYCFWHEQTGALLEIRSPLMPILQWTEAGDFTFGYRPPSSLSLASELIPTGTASGTPCCNKNGLSSCMSSSSSSSSSSSNRERDWGSAKAKAKAKSSKKNTSFFLDSDTSTSDNDGKQDQYDEEDSFIVPGDEDISEDETDGQGPEKEGNSACKESKSKSEWNCKFLMFGGGSGSDHDNGDVNDNNNNDNDPASDEDSEEYTNTKQRHSKRLRTNRLIFESDSEDE